MALNFGDREVMKIKITYKNFRNEPSEKLSFKLHCPVNSLLKKDISIFNIKTSFPFKIVCLYLKLKKKQAHAKSFVTFKGSLLYFTRHSCVVILFFVFCFCKTGLIQSLFFAYTFGKPIFLSLCLLRLSVFYVFPVCSEFSIG